MSYFCSSCRVFREIQEIHKNEFDFSEDVEPFDAVETLCESMQVSTVIFMYLFPNNFYNNFKL